MLSWLIAQGSRSFLVAVRGRENDLPSQVIFCLSDILGGYMWELFLVVLKSGTRFRARDWRLVSLDEFIIFRTTFERVARESQVKEGK